MRDDDFHRELRYILKGACVLDVVVYLVSLVLSVNVSVLLGLLLGTLVLYVNLNLLMRDIRHAVDRGSSRVRTVCGYLLRYLLIGSAFYFAVEVGVVNPYAVVVVQLYPRVLYTLKSIITKERSC